MHNLLFGEEKHMASIVPRTRARLAIESLEQRALLAADVYISEIVASNDQGVLDEDGDAPDWIEIFNAGPDDISLDGWHLTDDATNLQKWSFPSQELTAGNFILVYASDKNRAVAGSPLHTNFKLTSAGEYLALTSDGSGGTVNFVSEFTPAYPFQFTDISYGLGQSVGQTEISSPDAAAKLFVPLDDSLGKTWTATSFDDSSWTSATASIGYQQTVPGFTVQDAKSNGNLTNLSEATAVLDGTNQASESIAIAAFVDFRDPGWWWRHGELL